jgi:hypothetical protein
MITVRANAGTPVKRDIARRVARWMAAEGLPISRNIRLNINFRDDIDVYGEAVWVARSCYHSRSFTITVNNNISDLNLLLETLVHEMVHIHQMANRVLRWNLKKDDYVAFWKGTRYASATDYKDQPWEHQAYALEGSLVNRYLDHIQGR